MKKILKIILWIIFIPILLFVVFLSYISIVDYLPERETDLLPAQQKGQADIVAADTLKMISWNIGYAGLGKESDFFYDGGTSSRPGREMMEKYMKGIQSFIQNGDSIDFWLIQEIDKKSKRTYKTNQLEAIHQVLPEHKDIFALNYKVPYIPVPLSDPMGNVEAGLMTSSRFMPSRATRVSYPLIASWPDKLFLLDRCFIMTRHPLPNGKDLVVMNTHNTAFIYDADLRSQELKLLREYMLEEYKKGNYVIAGGDWNMNPPGYFPGYTYNGHHFVESQVKMETDFFPQGWQWAYDNSAPTNRKIYQAYVKGENGTTCLDYFLVSPNVELIRSQTIDLDFINSDHNPVFIKVVLGAL